jgi:hypothetical protein
MTVLAAVLALAAAGPAAPAAVAQSAGDDQYEDPFAGEDQGGGEEEPAPEAPAPAPEAPSSTAPEPEPAAPAAQPGSPQQPELPRTGLDAAPILAVGAVLLGGGIALRVRLRERA